MELLSWLTGLIAQYSSLKYVIVFLGAAFGGEPAVIALSFLTAQGLFSVPTYLLVSFAGILLSDSLYFYLGRTKIIKKIIGHRYAVNTINVIIEAIERLSKGRHMLAFVLAKFVIGTRAVIIMYVSKTGLSFGYFLRHNLPAICIWLMIVFSVGYLSGLGFAYISRIVENIYAGLGFVLLVLIALFIIQSRLKKAFLREEDKILEEKI